MSQAPKTLSVRPDFSAVRTQHAAPAPSQEVATKAGRRLTIEIEGDDVLTDALNALGLRSRIFCRSELAAPWTLGVSAGDYAHFHIVHQGGCWLRPTGARSAIALDAGDLIVLPRGKGHELSDSPARDRVRFQRLPKTLRPGGIALIKGGGTGPVTYMICGSFQFRHGEGRSLLLQLPDVLHLKGSDGQAPEWLASTLTLLMLEARHPRLGRSAMMARLTDIVLIHVLRQWIDTSPHRTGWLVALRDERIGGALSRLHADLGREWSVDALAREVAMSRSAFAARFTALLGEPPLTYLAHWRMLQAAHLLRTTELSLNDIASRVGYVQPAAFQKSFKRHFGATPGVYRRQPE